MSHALRSFFSLALIAALFGSAGGYVGFMLAHPIEKIQNGGGVWRLQKIEEESAVIAAVEKTAPAVVSIVVTKDLPKIEQFFEVDPFFGFRIPRFREHGTERHEIGGGSGFIVSQNGFIVTNKHVVLDEEASYSVLLNDGKTFEANVLARDPINDIAVLKIEATSLPTLAFGDSDAIKLGQTAITIGNALGEFQNTVSVGVISGLTRSITARGAGIGAETLTNLIQTDAAINPGNSGGPLLNLFGEVIGINTAVAGGAENIGFAIPTNEVKRIIESVQKNGTIIRPYLGVRFVMLTDQIIKENTLSVTHGALVIRGESPKDLAVIPGSPADKAGIVENDILLEVNGKKIDLHNPLHKLIATFSPGETVALKIFHKGEKKIVTATLEELQ